MAPRLFRNERVFWLAFSLLTAIVMFAMVLPYPLCSDVCIFQWMALRLVRGGQLPYVGAWDHNFPGVLLFHVPSVLIFGPSEFGFRIVEASFQVVTSLIFYRLLLRWLAPRTAFLAVFFYALGATSWGSGYVGQRDVLAAGLFIWGLAAWEKRQAGSIWFLVSAFIFGLCALIRPTFGLPPLTILFFARKEIGRSAIVQFLVAMALPFLLSLVPYLLTGTIGQYYNATILFNLGVYESIGSPIRQLLIRMKDAMKLDGFALLAILPAKILPTARRNILHRSPEHREFLVYGICILEFFLLYVVQQKYILVYGFAPVLALLAPVSAVGLERLLARFHTARVRAVAGTGILLAIFLKFSIVIPAVTAVATHDLHPLIPYADDPVLGFQAEKHVLDYLDRPQNASGTIEIVSFNARLRLKANRQEASPFPMPQALAVHPVAENEPDFQRQWNRDFISDIIRAPAKLVLIGDPWDYWSLPALGPNLKWELPTLDSVLHANYRYDTTIGAYTVYRIRTASTHA